MTQRMYEGRACYRQQFPGDETYDLDVPIFEEDNPSSSPSKYEKRTLTAEEILEELGIIEENFPDMPAFEALKLYFPAVCPTSLTDHHLLFYIETEQAVREYNTLPFDGGLWDQPYLLLEIFTVIRSVRNQYDRIRFEEMSKKAQKTGHGSQGKTIHTSLNEELPPRQGNISA